MRERKSISLSIHINPNKTRNHYCYRCHSLIILTCCGHLLFLAKLPQNSVAKANHEFYGSVIWRRHDETNMSVLHVVWGLKLEGEGWNLASSKCSFTRLFGVRCWVSAGSVLRANVQKEKPCGCISSCWPSLEVIWHHLNHALLVRANISPT